MGVYQYPTPPHIPPCYYYCLVMITWHLSLQGNDTLTYSLSSRLPYGLLLLPDG